MASLRSRLRAVTRRGADQKEFDGVLASVRAGLIGTRPGMLLDFEVDERRGGTLRERVYTLELGSRELDALLDALVRDPVAMRRLRTRLERATAT